MDCSELAARIQGLRPEAEPVEVAGICILLLTHDRDTAVLEDDEGLKGSWNAMSLRLQIATDQHQAMTEELEELAESDPRQFTSNQISVLLRAIKVQSQILQLYIGLPVPEGT